MLAEGIERMEEFDFVDRLALNLHKVIILVNLQHILQMDRTQVQRTKRRHNGFLHQYYRSGHFTLEVACLL